MESVKTITYSKVGPLEIKLDLHIPPGLTSGSYPALVYFHGGGFVTGNREGLVFQRWLSEILAKNKVLHISADYRLLTASTGFSIIEDTKALFSFIGSPDFSSNHLPADVKLDVARIAVTGESCGGYPAIAAGVYANPKPRAVVLQYTAGGNFLSDHYLRPKPDGAPLPDGGGGTVVVPREAVAQYLDGEQEELADDPVGFLNGNPAQGGGERTALIEYLLGEGILLDALLGRPGISRELLNAGPTLEEREKAVPEELREGVVQLNVGKDFPPTFSFHGDIDQFFLADESETLHKKLQALGVRSEFHFVERGGHGLVDVAKLPEVAIVDTAAPIQNKAAEWLLQELK